MGRRALRKIDPAYDLADFFFEPESVACPFDAGSFYGRKAQLEVEVGTGKGLFLATMAEVTPDVDFLGLEVSRKYARFAAARCAKAELDNAKMICGDALRFFRENLVTDSVQAVHIYFPDPWWKKRHQKRRVITESFLHDVERVLLPGGVLHFWSDVQEYFDLTVKLVAAHTSLGEPSEVQVEPARHELDYRTHFERRMRLNDLPVYRAEFRLA